MNQVFRPFLRHFVIVFFDYILIYSSNEEEHVTHLKQVLQLLREHTFFAKLSKCQFFQRTIEYLGHFISSNGVQADPSKVAAIVNWPIPRTLKQLRGFLGLTGCYRRFVAHYATIAAPLTELLKRDSFVWTTLAATAFTQLKKAMTDTPVLKLADFSKVFILETDASNVGIGGVMQDGYPLAYFSKKLGPRFAGASAYIREMRAIVEAVSKWRQYLLGLHFIIRTDHKSLRELLTQVIQTPEQQHFIRKLLEELRQENITCPDLRLFHEQLQQGQLDATQYTGMRKDVHQFVLACLFCQTIKYSPTAPHGLLQPLEIPERVWEDLAMDFIVGLPNSRGVTNILVVVDRFTKYAHFGALPNHYSATKVADLFSNMVIRLHAEYPKQWSKFLSWAEYHYNTSHHSAIGMTPFQAVYGRTPPSIPAYTRGATTIQAVEADLLKQDEILHHLKHNLQRAQQRMQQQANKKRRDIEFQVGELVLVKLQPYRQTTVAHRLNSKLCRRYFGPFEVLARAGPVAYTLKLPQGSRIHPTLHVSLLKPYHGSQPLTCYPLPEFSIANKPVMVPLAIIATRIHMRNSKPTRQVLVQWFISSPEDATWEDFDTFVQMYKLPNLADKACFGEGSSVSEAQEVGPIKLEPKGVQEQMRSWENGSAQDAEEAVFTEETHNAEAGDPSSSRAWENRACAKRERARPRWMREYVMRLGS
ncbi:uncharacterized protein LOC133799440 [Humulus lupulus]|uniref:uncharacterized protein LOC133799440 n=1 Tax=Humulus lupulus TaxID=3486 RepID=UPI002B416432|nr:uncharacterized protein LOC133799440 [Humulus lupulus]